MNLAQKALQELFPKKKEQREILLRYSARFASYNANVSYSSTKITFSLSKSWKEISDDIRQGVIEHLMCKMYGIKKQSTNQDLYHSFMKHLSNYSEITHQDPFLLERFDIVNDQYFLGLMPAPNLKWGKTALRKLGHYEYATDTIVISAIFENAKTDQKIRDLLDFVIYHEMLHKKHKYDHKKTRARHHSKAFREDEAKWHDKDVEKKLQWFVSKKKLKKAFFGW